MADGGPAGKYIGFTYTVSRGAWSAPGAHGGGANFRAWSYAAAFMGLSVFGASTASNDAHDNHSWNIAKEVAVLRAVTVEASRRRL